MILAKFSDRGFGLTDATTMALAERLACPVLTRDLRHLGTFRTRRGAPLTLLP